MDSRTDFDDDERFFGSYDAERAAVEGASEVDAIGPEPPTPEQLAHLNRFRRPVAWVVAGLALFSLLAIEERGAQRKYVAHYNAALPAPPPKTSISAEPSPAPEAAVEATALLGEMRIEADSEPAGGAVGCGVNGFVSELTAMCWARTRSLHAGLESASRGNAAPTELTTCSDRTKSSGALTSSPLDDLLEAIGSTFGTDQR